LIDACNLAKLPAFLHPAMRTRLSLPCLKNKF
jgi:hypothetical protein